MPWYFGIEIGGTKLQAALAKEPQTIDSIIEKRVDPSAGASAIRDQILDACRELQELTGVREVSAAGIGFGGPVDSCKGRVLVSNQIEGWSGFPICQWLGESLAIRSVFVMNDSDAATLAESQLGAGRGYSPVLYVNSGSGVGGGLTIDGQVYPGSGIGAIEIGHVWVEELPEPLRLEQVASGWAIARAGRDIVSKANKNNSLLFQLANGDPAAVSGELVASAALNGDSQALQVYGRATRAMGRALAQAITLLAPQRVVLGGGVAQTSPSLWIDPIRQEIDRSVFASFLGSFAVVTAELGQLVVVHGALALAAENSSKVVGI